MMEMTDKEFNDIVSYIKNNYGLNLTQKKGLMEGRLSHKVQDKGFDNYADYFKMVLDDKSGNEITNLINILTTNHTFFLRENQHFDFMQNVVLPKFTREIADYDLRIWSAGCSSGEEAYTTAMLIDDYLGMEKSKWDSTILATDISMKVLDKGREGIYPGTSLGSIPDQWKKKYFNYIGDDTYQVKDNMRKQVIFRVLNLMDPSFPFKKKFHLIFCRNVMIYFDGPTKKALIKKFYDLTVPGGYLFIGHAESITRADSDYVYLKPAIYQKPV